MTKLQKVVIHLLSNSWERLDNIAKKAGCSQRALEYWLDGKRVPRDVEIIEHVIDALGYEIAVRPKKGNR
ncbi:MAG: hypothetical protein IIY21_03560 [Clostridiales bacterium]|nr:hypothetical protein [Clostridiales bacterium]MBQ1570216.1 hypothetical protein [Clostridiales bacterium]